MSVTMTRTYIGLKKRTKEDRWAVWSVSVVANELEKMHAPRMRVSLGSSGRSLEQQKLCLKEYSENGMKG
jgi:hypothetical protein